MALLILSMNQYPLARNMKLLIWKAGQPDYRRNVHLKSLKQFFSYELSVDSKTSPLGTAINIQTNSLNFEGVLD